MAYQYHIDLAKYSLQKFKDNLSAREMLPSREILKNKLDERFKILENRRISNLKDLTERLKTKGKIEKFSQESGLPIQYLTILNREAKSYLPNPIRIDKFPGIETNYVARLVTAGIINSRQLFNKGIDRTAREQLAQSLDIPIKIMDELVSLADLARAYGVGPVFARLLHDVGIKSIQEFVRLTAEEIIQIYEAQEQKRADFGVNEIQFSLDLAKELDIDVEL